MDKQTQVRNVKVRQRASRLESPLFHLTQAEELPPEKSWFSSLMQFDQLARNLAVVGALLIGMNSIAGMSGDITGDLLALAGAIMMAGHWLCNRYARRTVEALPFMLLLYTQTAVLLALTLPFLGGFQMTWMALLAVAGLAVGCTLLGHSMFTLALGKVSATVVSFALLGEPVGAMLWSMVMFGEIPTPLLFVGGTVTVLGLVLYLMGSMGMLKKK